MSWEEAKWIVREINKEVKRQNEGYSEGYDDGYSTGKIEGYNNGVEEIITSKHILEPITYTNDAIPLAQVDFGPQSSEYITVGRFTSAINGSIRVHSSGSFQVGQGGFGYIRIIRESTGESLLDWGVEKKADGSNESYWNGQTLNSVITIAKNEDYLIQTYRASDNSCKDLEPIKLVGKVVCSAVSTPIVCSVVDI